MTAFIASWLASIPTFAIPLLLASVGLILSERAGIVSLGAEGYGRRRHGRRGDRAGHG